MKRLFGVVLILLLTFGAFSVYAFAESEQVNNEVTNVVKLLGIANGDENGNMDYDGNVTRAQFVKMAVCASSSKDEAVNTNLNVSLFYDVKNSYWGAGYISVAINNGLVNGYLDGTFKPDNSVTLEEAVTVVLKLLGYTSSDFAGPYPAPQLEKYKSLELNKGIDAIRGQKLTRYQCMLLLYNALSTKTKQGAVYCTTLGYEANSEGKLDYTALLEDKTDGPVIVTDVSSWQKHIPFNVTDNTSIMLDGNSVSADSIRENDILYYSDKLMSITVYRKTATGVVSLINFANNSPSSVSLSNGKVYILATNSVKEKFSTTGKYSKKDSFVTLLLGRNDQVIQAIDGKVDYIYDNTDNAEYLDMLNATISTPFVVEDDKWTDKIPFDVTNASIYLNGSPSTQDKINVNDAVYYSQPFESVWAFRKTASGVMSFANGTSVSVGGKTYALATDKAKLKVSSYGEFEEDDYITLILGKDSEVVDVQKATIDDIGNKDNDSSYYEVVSSTLEGPYIAGVGGNLSKLPFDIDESEIFKGSGKITSHQIRQYDVYYYSELLNTVWIYRDTVTGTIEAITPMISPTSVVVSGKTYTLETSQASYDLSSFGTFHVGDDVTLLLGKDGVAAVMSPETAAGTLYGIVTDIGTKSFSKKDGTMYTADYVSVTDTTCTTYTYEYDNSYLEKGDIVRVTYENSMKISEIPPSANTKGVAETLKDAIFNGKFAKDCQIIDTSNGNAMKIYPSRIKGLDIDTYDFTFGKGIVLYYSFDNDGNIEKLILNDFTGDFYNYGIAYTYGDGKVKYMLDSTVMNYTGTGTFDGAVRIDESDLTGISSSIDVDVLTKTSAYDIDQNEYKLSSDVKVYIRDGVAYEYADLDEVIEGNYIFKAYYDKIQNRGGRIRVIVAQRKV